MSEWNVIDPEKIEENAFQLIGKDWMLVTAGKKDGSVNTMTASWGGVGILWGKKVAFVFIRPARYTKEFVDESEVLSLSFYDNKYRDMLKYMGTVSGRDENKVEKMGLTVERDGEVPYFAEASLVMECRKLYVQNLEEKSFLDPKLYEKWYDHDLHIMYIVEIEKVLTR